jgi:hypothetical protein
MALDNGIDLAKRDRGIVGVLRVGRSVSFEV